MTEVRVLCIPLKINDGGGRRITGKTEFLCIFKYLKYLCFFVNFKLFGLKNVFFIFSTQNHAESFENYLKILFLDLNRAKLNQTIF